MADPAAVEAVRLGRVYPGVVGGAPVQGLTDVSLTVGRGEVVAVTGPSGSGKTTLLYLLAGLDRPDAGSVRLAGVDWASLRGRARARFRRRTCGVIAQGMALLPQATAAENVEAPLLLAGTDPAARARRVGDALDRVGLAAHAAKLPDQLSGGQQQRVAIARALVTEPAVVLADEPTATLDSENARLIAGLLVESARARASAVVLVTHDAAVAAHADRVVRLHSGRLHSGGPA
ncbi:MAG TPA: ATP-binding cassette domain-containing protein [Mycobacteriales bacterium]|jgi:putative ABC transport system ATP-binding protein|nr:ATP-binding cassette domain-containing protein [Mycobacteriales bacterium]